MQWVRKTELYNAANIECARIIAADPVRYPGLMQEWARLVLERHKPTLAEKLFDSEAA